MYTKLLHRTGTSIVLSFVQLWVERELYRCYFSACAFCLQVHMWQENVLSAASKPPEVHSVYSTANFSANKFEHNVASYE